MSVPSAQVPPPLDGTPRFGFGRGQGVILLAILAVQLVLVSPSLMPAFPDINGFDEAQYVVSGRQLLQFQVRDLAWGPLVGVFYAPLHLLLGWSPDWFVLETWVGRILLFALLSASTIILARQFEDRLNPLLLAGMLFVNVPFLRVVQNQSDAIMASLSALILAKLLQIRRTARQRDIVVGSILLGLCVLSRAEAVVFLVLYPFLVVVLTLKQGQRLRHLAASMLPALAILVVYLGLFRWSTGTWDLGFSGKSYTAFQAHQPVISTESGLTPREQAAQLYGTPSENQSSVLRAIAKNPLAFAQRVWIQALTLPGFFLGFYQKQLGPVIALLFVWGCVEMIHKRQFLGLAIPAVWSFEAVGSIPFVSWHLVSQLSPIVLIFAGLGLSRILSRSREWKANVMHSASFLALAAAGFAFGYLGLAAGGVIVLGAFMLTSLLRPNPPSIGVPSLVFLMAGLILRTPFPFPSYASLGTSSEEQSIHYLEQSIPADSLVMAPLPGPAVAARMNNMSPNDVPADALTDQGLSSFIKSKGVAAVYLDREFRGSEKVYRLLNDLAGKELRIAFTSSDGRIRVLVPVP
jgi:hypothetical protein